MDLLLARRQYRLVVECPARALVSHLRDALGPPSRPRPAEAVPYVGEVSEAGFLVRRVAAYGKDTRASVTAQGRFEPAGAGTAVEVRVRHWWAMLVFGWLLLLIAAPSALRDPVAAAVLGGLAALWYVRLNLNVRRVGREVRALLSEGHGL